MENKIKCKFCDWMMIVYHTSKCQNAIGIETVYGQLNAHMLINHSLEHADLQRVLEENCADRQRDFDRDEYLICRDLANSD